MYLISINYNYWHFLTNLICCRELAARCREKDFSKSWPFGEEYLQKLHERGVNVADLLPKLSEGKSKDEADAVEHVELHTAQNDLLYVAEGKNETPKSNPRENDNRRKGKSVKFIKKRSMVDILAHAPHSTQEEMDKMYKH